MPPVYKVRIERKNGVTRITDLDTGEPLGDRAAALEIFQSSGGLMLAQIKLIAMVNEADIECEAKPLAP